MKKEEKDQKVWKIIDQYENNEIGFEEAIDKFAELNNNDVNEVIADLEYMICGVLTEEAVNKVTEKINKRKEN